MDDLVLFNLKRLALKPFFSRSRNAGLSSFLCSVDNSPGPAEILVNSILMTRLLVRLDLLPFGKSPSSAMLMIHSEEISRMVTISFFSVSKYSSSQGTVVWRSENIKLNVYFSGIVGSLDVLKFGCRPAKYTEPVTLLMQVMPKAPESLSVEKNIKKSSFT